MSRKRIAIKYTSLKCRTETDDGWSAADEPYAVFVAVHDHWYKVSYTHSYEDVDAGESRGVRSTKGDVYLIAPGDDRFYVPTGRGRSSPKASIYVFLMERDAGNKSRIVSALKSHLKRSLARVKAGANPGPSGYTAWPPTAVYLQDLVKAQCARDWIDDDNLIRTKVWTQDFSGLGADGYRRKTVAFSGDGGRYDVRFSLFLR